MSKKNKEMEAEIRKYKKMTGVAYPKEYSTPTGIDVEKEAKKHGKKKKK